MMNIYNTIWRNEATKSPYQYYHIIAYFHYSELSLYEFWEAIKIIETGQGDITHATNLKAVHQFTDICEGSTHQTGCLLQ